jgi:hypothetical protein
MLTQFEADGRRLGAKRFPDSLVHSSFRPDPVGRSQKNHQPVTHMATINDMKALEAQDLWALDLVCRSLSSLMRCLRPDGSRPLRRAHVGGVTQCDQPIRT